MDNQDNKYDDKLAKKIKEKIDSYQVEYNEAHWLELKSKLQSNADTDVTRKKPDIHFSFIWKVAAALIIALGMYYIINKNLIYGETYTYVTTNTVNSFLLPDSSNVWLNKSTKLFYTKTKKVREVHLEGEAYFEVKKNVDKPFIIYTKYNEIKVVGTSFNVRVYPDKNSEIIWVTSGIVKVKSRNDSNNEIFILTKDQKIEYDISKRDYIKNKITDSNFLVWKTKEFKFIDTPLVDVTKILSDYFSKNIYLSDTSLYSLKLTGSVKADSLSEILAAICQTFDLEIFEGRNQFVIKRGTNDKVQNYYMR